MSEKATQLIEIGKEMERARRELLELMPLHDQAHVRLVEAAESGDVARFTELLKASEVASETFKALMKRQGDLALELAKILKN